MRDFITTYRIWYSQSDKKYNLDKNKVLVNPAHIYEISSNSVQTIDGKEYQTFQLMMNGYSNLVTSKELETIFGESK